MLRGRKTEDAKKIGKECELFTLEKNLIPLFSGIPWIWG